jgi:hypothetical protein
MAGTFTNGSKLMSEKVDAVKNNSLYPNKSTT